MCYHISQTEKDIDKILNQFDCEDFDFGNDDPMPFYYDLNGFSRENVMIITEEEPNLIQLAKWSISPPNHNQPSLYWSKVGGGSLNTKVESIYDEYSTRKTPQWKKSAIMRNKCIVLVTGLFKVFTGSYNPITKKNNKHSILVSREKRVIFGVLGYYTEQLLDEKYCSILTTNSDDFFDFHKRMPFTIDPSEKNKIFNTLKNQRDFAKFILEHKSINDLKKYEVTKNIFNSTIDTNNEDALLKINSNINI